MRVGSLFTGVGGFDLAAESVGWDVAWQSEVDKYCLRVLADRWPDVPQLGSVAEIGRSTPVDVDVLVGGSPCQGFSIAGVGMGLQDERSGLFGEMVRVARELQPEWVVWENVPGALTSGKGEDFANVLAAMVGSPEPLHLPMHPNGRRSRYAGVARGPLGTFAWRTLDAQHFGVPQRRSRVIGIRHADADTAVDALFDGFVWPDPDVDCDDAWAAALDHDDAAFDWGDVPENPKRVLLRDVVETDPELVKDYLLSKKACEGILRRATNRGKTMPALLEVALRATAGIEVDDELLQRVLELDEVDLVPVDLYNESMGDVAQTVQAGNGGNRMPHVVTFRKSRRAASREDYETWVEEDEANTLNTFENSDVRATNLVICHPDPAGNLTERYHKGVNTTFDDGAVVVMGFDAWSSTVDDHGDISPVMRGGTRPAVLEDLRVRRLTPRECERLQGFPDDHTAIKGVSNTQRYKQMGNAVAVPVAEWVFRRIAAK